MRKRNFTNKTVRASDDDSPQVKIKGRKKKETNASIKIFANKVVCDEQSDQRVDMRVFP